MSRAEEIGESSAFSRAGTARSARGRVIRDAIEGSDPTQLALHLLGHNPDNPREQLGDVTDLANSLRDHGQKQALGIMSREAYLKANPGREEDLEPRAMYVVIDGNRRLAAAREAGLGSLKVTLDDQLGGDSNEILESALVANIHREAFEPLDEAKALQQLLTIHGTQEALAQRLHRSQGWISQRMALLNLTPDLKQRLEEGSESVVHLRRVGNKPADQQEALLAKLKSEREAKEAAKAERQALRKAAARRGEPDDDAGPPPAEPAAEPVSTGPRATEPTAPSSAAPGQTTDPDHYGVMKPRPLRPSSAAPSAADTDPAVILPWHNPVAVAQIAWDHMQLVDFERMIKEGQRILDGDAEV